MFRGRWLSYVLITGSLVCIALPFCFETYGISNDTRTYVSTAESLAHGDGFRAADGTFPVEFAPFYTLAIALLLKLGASQAGALAIINIFAMAGTLAFVSAWVWRRTASLSKVDIALAATGFGYPMLYVSCWGWSEPLFICFCLGAWFFVDEYATTRRSRRTVLLAVSFLSLACLTRYAGVVLLVMIGVLLVARGVKRLAAVVTIISGLPLLGWIAFNHLAHDSAAGSRGPARISFFESMQLGFGVVSKWFVGPLPLVLLDMGMLAFLLWGVRMIALRGLSSPAGSVGFIAFGYGAGIIAIAGLLTGISPPNDRLMAPLYSFVIMAMMTIRSARFEKFASAWACVVVVAGISFTAARTFV